MAGNRSVYETAMSAGHNAAWEQNWDAAIQSYGNALREFPEDPEVHIHLGMALLEQKRLDQALKVFKRAHQLNPDDSVPLEKIADVYERQGRLQEAAQQYVTVSEIHLGQRDLDKAISNWERATRLTPGLIPIHARLAQAYERTGEKRKALREYLTLAFNFRRKGDTERAIRAVQRALQIDPKNPQALNTLRALETGGDIAVPTAEEVSKTPEPEAETLDLLGAMEPQQPEEQADDSLGPLGESLEEGLMLLAAHVMESGDIDMYKGMALQAMELQRQSKYDEAIAAYRQAERGLQHPAIMLNLGALLLFDNQLEEAAKYLEGATSHPDLDAGAYHALGQVNFKLGKHKAALQYFLRSLQSVDTDLAMSPDEVAELSVVYEQLRQTLVGRDEEATQTINERFMNLLSSSGWKQRIPETRRQLQETMRTEGEQVVFEQLTAEGGDELTEVVALIDRYIRQGLLTLAMDEAHRAVEVSPEYLPVHLRMAEVMMTEGRVRSAIEKFNMVARTYLVRGDNNRAASILVEVLEMAPLDISVRKNLIELLEIEERWEEALNQYIDLADTYHQLGNFEIARDTFVAAERLAQRVGAQTETTVRIKHRIADIDQLRLELRRAQQTYEEIVRLDPDDERARRMLVDLNYRQGNHAEALNRLDQLLSVYARKKQVNRITQLLEELVKLHPDDMGVRSRLGAIYRQLGRTEEAVAELDALAEQQLEAGMHQEACNTVKQIVALNPPGVEDYRLLLQQLGC
ncbi:MAG: tetratricopeptide repeat protein [Chloroflexi bacterium]|nr:MAG: hypothetical protein CUN54_02230 [Phototrophicales bacterium]RMF79889.1 MAG: tetratricopeptide repeat protein [Chloroflexota bacterium]